MAPATLYKLIMKSGIYSIVNRTTGKIYIGSSKDIDRRFKEHKSELNRGIHSNGRLQNAWNKYSESDFEFNIVELCDIDNLLIREVFYVNKFNSLSRVCGFNIETPGRPVLSEATKKKISHAHCGKKISSEHKNKLLCGAKRAREKLSKLHSLGLYEYPMHICDRVRMLGDTNPFYGKHHSESSKRAIGAANAKLNNFQVRVIKQMIKMKYTNRFIAKMFNVNERLISSIKCGKTWSHISIQEN